MDDWLKVGVRILFHPLFVTDTSLCNVATSLCRFADSAECGLDGLHIERQVGSNDSALQGENGGAYVLGRNF